MSTKKLVSDAHFGIRLYGDLIKQMVSRAVRRGFRESPTNYGYKTVRTTIAILRPIENAIDGLTGQALTRQYRQWCNSRNASLRRKATKTTTKGRPKKNVN